MIGCYRTAVLVLALLLGHGCAMRRNVDLLEGRLRQQEDSLSEMQTRLSRTQNELASTRKEADQLRTQIAARGEKTLLSEQADVLYRTAGIDIDRMRTGGLDNDGKPGDDMLNAAIVPHDKDGELLKVAGSVELELLDLAKPELQQRVGKWSFNSDESREHWHRSFLGGGYVFKVPLKQPPESSQLVLHATLVTPDGRRFNASEPIRVNPAGVAGDVANTGLAKSNGPPRESSAKDDSPSMIRPTGGERLIAPPPPSNCGSQSTTPIGTGRSTFGPTGSTSSRVNAARPTAQRMSYEREGDSLFDLTPTDGGEKKARLERSQSGGAKPRPQQEFDPFGEPVATSNRKTSPASGEANKSTAAPFDSDLRPSVAPPELDEFGLPKNWQRGNNAATPSKPLPDWAH